MMTTASVHDASSQAHPAKKPSRLTLSGAFLGIAITAALFAQLFSAYWLILAAFAALGFTQSCSFDLAQIEQRERRRR